MPAAILKSTMEVAGDLSMAVNFEGDLFIEASAIVVSLFVQHLLNVFVIS